MCVYIYIFLSLFHMLKLEIRYLTFLKHTCTQIHIPPKTTDVNFHFPFM